MKIRTDLNTIFLLSIICLFAALTFPMLTLRQPVYDLSVIGADFNAEVLRYARYALLLLLVCDVLIFRRMLSKLVLSLQSDPYFLCLFGLVILIFVMSLASLDMATVIYSLVFLFLVVNFHYFWFLKRSERTLFYKASCLMIFLYLSLAFLINGAPHNRWVGGIHPNILTSASVAGGVFALLGFKRAGPFFLLAFLASAVVVSSRYAMVILVLLFVLRAASSIKKITIQNAIISLVAIGILLLAIVIKQDSIVSALEINSTARGLGSGLSGRTELYDLFIPQISQHPFSGFGFRQRTEYYGVHNGYLNFVLENGVVIGISFIFLLGFNICRSAFSYLNSDDETKMIFGGFLSVAIGCFFQPQLINFGDPMGVVFIFLLARGRLIDKAEPSVVKRRKFIAREVAGA